MTYSNNLRFADNIIQINCYLGDVRWARNFQKLPNSSSKTSSASIWKGVSGMKIYKRVLVGIKRQLLLRIAMPYRTMSGEALYILPKKSSLDFLVR